MDFPDVTNVAHPDSHIPQGSPGIPPTDGLWTSQSPLLLPPSPIPGEPRNSTSDFSFSVVFPRKRFGLCANKSGDVYFYGGEAAGRVDDGLYYFSTKDNAITPLHCWGADPGGRYDHAMTVAGDFVAVQGGRVSDHDYVDPSLFLLNLSSREWTRIEQGENGAPGTLVGHCMTTIGTTIYLFGGSEWGNRYYNDLWSFDVNTLRTQPEWELVRSSSYNAPFPRDGCSLVSYKNYLILFAGWDGAARLNDVWSFDLKSKRWSELQCIGDIPSPRRQHAAVVLDDVLYVIGGVEGSYTLDDVFALKIPEQRWFKIGNRVTAPITCYGHAAMCIGTKLFTFGGACREGRSEEDSILILDVKYIENPHLHTPERLKALEIELPNVLSQVGTKNQPSDAVQVPSEGLASENLRQEHRVQQLSDQLLKEKVNAEELSNNLQMKMEELEEEVAKVKVLDAKVEELVAQNSKLEERTKQLEHAMNFLRRSQIIPSILESPSKMDSLTGLQGTDAQVMVDFLAEVLGTQDPFQSNDDRRRILHLLIKLTKSAQVFPQRAELSDVQCNLATPVNSEGGFGLIYRGIFKQQAVCVKAVRILDYGTHARKLMRAQAGELTLLGHISHPNVISLYGVYLSNEERPRICIVTPWMENGNLANFLESHPNTPQLPLMCDVAVGLEFLHDMGITHADLKARNVLVTQSRRALLADFGVSTVLNTNVGTTTAQDFSKTDFWAAPELHVADKPPSPQSDMWGFACICFEALTGEAPFAKYYRTVGQFILALSRGQITPLRPKQNIGPTITGDGPLVTLAEKCWNHDPDQRPTATQAVQFLTELNVQDNRPSMEDEITLFETIKNGEVEVKVDYARVLFIVQKKI